MERSLVGVSNGDECPTLFQSLRLKLTAARRTALMLATVLALVVTKPTPAGGALGNPPPQVDSIVPATVCEGGVELTINGSGFHEGATVSLGCTGVTDNAWAVSVAADGTQIRATFDGTGANPGDVCDVTVTNPDGKEDALPHTTVTVLTGPSVFLIDPSVVYNGINTRITIYATTLSPPLPANAVTITPSDGGAPISLPFNLVPMHPNWLQAIVPVGTAPSGYDLTLNDASGCTTTLPNAITVVDAL
jgi:hypothetical protein